MLPKLISYGSLYLPTYGVLVALGFLAGLWVTVRLARRSGLNSELVTNLAAACEVPYYFGVRAQSERRFADAADWYRVAVECGMHNEGEYVFANAELYRFRAEKNALGRLR